MKRGGCGWDEGEEKEAAYVESRAAAGPRISEQNPTTYQRASCTHVYYRPHTYRQRERERERGLLSRDSLDSRARQAGPDRPGLHTHPPLFPSATGRIRKGERGKRKTHTGSRCYARAHGRLGFFTMPVRQGCTSARPETYVHMRRIHMRRPQSTTTTYQTGLAFGTPSAARHRQPSPYGSLRPRRNWLLALSVGKWPNDTNQVSNLRMPSLGAYTSASHGSGGF